MDPPTQETTPLIPISNEDEVQQAQASMTGVPAQCPPASELDKDLSANEKQVNHMILQPQNEAPATNEALEENGQQQDHQGVEIPEENLMFVEGSNTSFDGSKARPTSPGAEWDKSPPAKRARKNRYLTRSRCNSRHLDSVSKSDLVNPRKVSQYALNSNSMCLGYNACDYEDDDEESCPVPDDIADADFIPENDSRQSAKNNMGGRTRSGGLRIPRYSASSLSSTMDRPNGYRDTDFAGLRSSLASPGPSFSFSTFGVIPTRELSASNGFATEFTSSPASQALQPSQGFRTGPLIAPLESGSFDGYTASAPDLFNVPSLTLREPSRASGEEIPRSQNKTPGLETFIHSSQMSDAALLKRKLTRDENGYVSKRSCGPTDPENVAIVNMVDNLKMKWVDIAIRLNEERLKVGRTGKLTPNSVHNRYNRNAPIYYQAEDKAFIPICMRKTYVPDPNQPQGRFHWDDERDRILVEAHNQVESEKWERVAEIVNRRISDGNVTAEAVATRYNMI